MSEHDADLAGNGGDGTGDGDGSGEIDLSEMFLTGPGFGTLRFAGAVGTRPPPPVASTRGLLRARMPGIYQDDDFGMRFLAGLEELLDPIVALLDALPEHLSPDLAPADVLELITGWLGIQLNESQPTLERREIVRNASELGRRRGTRRGIELALALGFPSLPFRVEDGGGVAWSTDGELPEPPPPTFVVYCDKYIAEERQANVARLIEQVKPAHVAYKLRVKAPKAQRS
jgi:phage tail-like protein